MREARSSLDTMANPNAFYEPEEDELLSSLAVPAYQSGNDASYEDEYRRLQELEQHAYAQQMAAREQAELEHSQMLEMVPEDVKRFLVLFHQAILENDLPTITNMYESGWNKLTQAHYSQNEWPEAEVIAPLVQNGSSLPHIYVSILS